MGLHDKPKSNPYADMYRLGKPKKMWSDKSGDHFIYQQGDYENHYVISGKGSQAKLSRVSSTNVKASGQPTNQRYQVPANRQSATASAPTGGGKGKFHGNQYTAHGTDVPVKGPQPKVKAIDFTVETLLKSGGFQLPKMKHPIKTTSENAPNITNGAFWVESGSAPLVGGGKISVRDLTGPGTPSNPVWTITKPDGEKTVIHGLGLKDGKPTGIDSRGHGNYTATITRTSGEKEVIRQTGSKGSRTLYAANGQVGPKPITSDKKTHPFHGNQYTAHGKEVPVKTKKSVSGSDFTSTSLLGY